jgi:hypothetical protein
VFKIVAARRRVQLPIIKLGEVVCITVSAVPDAAEAKPTKHEGAYKYPLHKVNFALTPATGIEAAFASRLKNNNPGLCSVR